MLILAAVAAVLCYGWMQAFFIHVPDKAAATFVEETRLLVDQSVLGAVYKYRPPAGLGDKSFELPKFGISEKSEVTRLKTPKIFGGEKPRVILYRVTFRSSELSKKKGKGDYDYRLFLEDVGSLALPSWKVTKFITAARQEREEARASLRRTEE